MAERLRTIKVQVEVDTNKSTYAASFELLEDETAEELLARVRAWTADMLGSIA